MQLAVRANGRRAHLLVSTVLGKHIPTDPRLVRAAGLSLGHRVGTALGPQDRRLVVLGFAETATGLGQSVAAALDADLYLHSTRRRPRRPDAIAFSEEHAAAPDHVFTARDPGALTQADVLVLVDDELSSGRTALNAIEALLCAGAASARRYVVACLVDVRPEDQVQAFYRRAAALGVGVDVVSLCRGELRLPADVLARAARFQRSIAPAADLPAAPAFGRTASVERLAVNWPTGLPEGGRNGFTRADRTRLEATLPKVAAEVLEAVCGSAGTRPPHRVLVLGTEELMYVPMRIAEQLAGTAALRSAQVSFSSTTRSPALVVDAPDYPLRSALTFQAPDTASLGTCSDIPARRWVYNVHCPDTAARGGDTSWDVIVLVVDPEADTQLLETGGLVNSLRPQAGRVIVVVVGSPAGAGPLRGPEFGSYPAQDVGWLLSDLGNHPLEASVEAREAEIQAGRRHYSQWLPVEYQPDPDYLHVFQTALDRTADEVALAVGVVTERILSERGQDVVLASMARAGTPVGVLMRRWARFAHGLDLPHYSMSIVRDHGIDPVALSYLARRHSPSNVVFVDGWTGKGAIARELATALTVPDAHGMTWAGCGFVPELAVVADPGHCVRTFGTRVDLLIPSACLNSTVSGLVSRTVLRPDLTGRHAYHGAKFYRDLADQDLSARFLDVVTASFPAVRDQVARLWPQVSADAREPTWVGWASVLKIAREHGIEDVNLVKPGIGETTRVLLRRRPWKVLVRPGHEAELEHIRLLVARRGVQLEVVADLAFACVGLIRPAAVTQPREP